MFFIERAIRDGVSRISDKLPGGSDSRLETDGGVAAEGGGRLDDLRDSTFVRSLPFWFPPFLLMGFFVYGAIAWNLVISFTDFKGFTFPSYDPATFDLEMYTRAFADPSFIIAVRNTLVLLVVFTGLSLAAGLLLAMLIDRGIRFENWFRTIYLLPFSISFVVTAIFWRWMYNPSTGVINTVLEAVGLGALTANWLGGSIAIGGFTLKFKLFAVIFALLWQFSGYAMVIYLAGLRAIPDDQYEAARVDGASLLTLYRRVIIPQLRASTVSAAVVLMVFALKAFDFLYVMFGSNPGPAADILSTLMYRQAFGANNWAYGSAIAIVLFAMALVIIAPYLYSEYRRGAL
jgi:glucose/mannose transport system permease protein